MKLLRLLVLQLFVLFFASQFVFGQQDTSYIRLEDASGYVDTSYQDILDETARALVSVFPAEFQNSFKVYDFGSYLHVPNFEGGIDAVFQEVKGSIAAMTPYYLAFFKETNSEGALSKIYIDLVLPMTGDFSCMDATSPYLRSDVESKLGYTANLVHASNNREPRDIHKAFRATMDTLASFVVEQVSCCDPYSGTNACVPCVFAPQELLQKYDDHSMVWDLVFVVDDPGYGNGLQHA